MLGRVNGKVMWVSARDALKHRHFGGNIVTTFGSTRRRVTLLQALPVNLSGRSHIADLLQHH